MVIKHFLLFLLLGTLPAAVVSQGLTLSLYNNSAFAGMAISTTVIPSFNFSLRTDHPGSALVTGTMVVEHGMQYSFHCDFGSATVSALHIDDHLVCQQGANVGTTCGAPGSPEPCMYGDNPLPTMTRTALPIRLDVMFNGTGTDTHVPPINIKITVTASPASCIFNCTAPPQDTARPWLSSAMTLRPDLPPLEVQRRRLQQSLLQGWGMFYAMSYTDHVLLPHAARLNFAICEVGASGSCVTEARIDWPDKTALPVDIRLGMHSYDRSYNQLYIALGKCNISIATSGGGPELLVSIDVVSSPNAEEISSCERYALVPTGLSTWFRANDITADTHSIVFDSYGLGVTHVHATAPTNQTIPINTNLITGPHLTYNLHAGFAIGFNSGKNPIPLTQIRAKLDSARRTEAATYDKFGQLAETKEAVQSAVMWQLIWNPLEAGPFAPVIRGNPWGLDHDTANDDWAYVIFDWDNHFGSYMLSLDAKELGYSALIQVVQA